MNRARWLDHLAPWLAWGAIASTGAYEGPELAVMAAPLLVAALAEGRRWPLERWRRLLEILALVGFLSLVGARVGLLPTVVNTLFLLCGVRLCLPRQLPQRRQLLLMGFLLFLTTTITTSELDFLLWSVVWVIGAGTVLLQQAWEKSALLREGPTQAPPYRLLLPWTGAILVLAAGFFVTLPRLRLGFRSLPVGVQSLLGAQGGLTDVLDLSGKGPIQPNGEVVLRILPAGHATPETLRDFERNMGLLRGFVLEGLEDQRWQTDRTTPRRDTARWQTGAPGSRVLSADFFVSPTLLGLIPLPNGGLALQSAAADTLQFGQAGAVRWQWPARRILALHVGLTPSDLEREPPPRGHRLALLTATGTDTESALRWSLQTAPGAPAAAALAQRLSNALRGFRYTLDNPSGAAANPLADFLERSRAGHCEYFASALALMLRHRGVPARVVNGFRLGPWIEEGGYFRVSQGEAHSWVEFYDAQRGGWATADPTPAGAAPALAGGLLGALARWTDTFRFRWDRHVVRFSDEDQLSGLSWLQTQAERLGRWQPSPAWRRTLAAATGLGLLAALAGFGGRALLRRRPWRRDANPGRIRALAPLVRKARSSLPPLAGETARAWLTRLATLRPHRASQLETLAREADAVAYGGQAGATLQALAGAEAKAWTRQAPPGASPAPQDPPPSHVKFPSS